MVVIIISHLLAFWIIISTIIILELVSLLDIFIRLSSIATGTGALITAAGLVTILGPATGIWILVFTFVSECSRIHVGATARSGYNCDCVYCILLCSIALCKSALHVQGI